MLFCLSTAIVFLSFLLFNKINVVPCYLIDISKDGNKRVGGKRVLAFHKQVTSAAGPSLSVAVAHILTVALGLLWIFDGYEVTLISLYRNEIVAESSYSTFKSLVLPTRLGVSWAVCFLE